MNAETLLILHEFRLIILCSILFSYEFRQKPQVSSTLHFQNNFNTDTKKCISSYYYRKEPTQGLTSPGLSNPEQRSFKFFCLHLVLTLDTRTSLGIEDPI